MIDATGVPAAVEAGVELVTSAGRVVQVGMSGDSVDAAAREPHREGARRRSASPAAAPASSPRRSSSIERNAERLARLVSHEFPLQEAPEALRFAMEHPDEVMKVVIRV